MEKQIFENKWSAVSFISLLIFMGLFYQLAWNYPMVDSLPLVERLLDPGYLLNDFYTNTFEMFSPRHVIASVIAGISELSGLHYTQVVAWGNLLRIWLYGLGLYLLFLRLSNSRVALVAFAYAALSFLSVPFLPAWWPVTFDLTGSNVALLFAIFAWYFTASGQVAFALGLLSLSVVVHPLVGLHSLFISIVLFLVVFSFSEFRKLFTDPKIYILGGVYGGIFLFYYFSFEQVLSDERFIEINAIYRHGHHFFIGHMDKEKWISTMMMVVSALVLAIYLKRHGSNEKTLNPFVCYSAVLVVLAYIFVELIPTRFMVSYIPMRAFAILVPVLLLVFARFAIWKWENRDYTSFFLLFLPFLPYRHVGLTWFIFPGEHSLVLPLTVLVIILVLTAFSEFRPSIFKLPNQLIEKLFKRRDVGVMVAPIAFFALVLSVHRFEFNTPTLANSAEIYSWLVENTSAEEDIVLAELHAANNQKIRLLSGRAIVVGKDFPFNEAFYEQWYERYSSLYVDIENSRGHIDSLSPDELNYLMDKYGATILIRSQPLDNNSYFTKLTQTGGEKQPAVVYRNLEL